MHVAMLLATQNPKRAPTSKGKGRGKVRIQLCIVHTTINIIKIGRTFHSADNSPCFNKKRNNKEKKE